MSPPAGDAEAAARHYLESLRPTTGGDKPAEGIGELLALTSPSRVGVGAVLTREGDAAEGAFLVVKGRLRASVQVGGTERVVNEAGPGEIIGEAGIFITGGRRSATLTAIEETTTLALGRGLFLLSAHNPALIAIEQHLLRTLARRIANTDALITRAWRDAERGGRPALDGLSMLLGGGS